MKESRTPQRLAISLDLRILCALLALVILVMLALWRPWQGISGGSADSKITVRGEATVKGEPDQFQFNPMYELDTVEAAAKHSTDVTARLKELGVADKDIKVNASAYDTYPTERVAPSKPTTTNTVSLTITLTDKELAQKVQNYLVTTNPKGAITPYPTFSEAKRKSLEDEARNLAVEDARKRADQTAQRLKAKVGDVIEVKEGGNFGIMPMYRDGAVASPEADASTSLPIQAGENEYTYSVEVSFALK